MSTKDFTAVKDQVLVYADGIHDDTAAATLIMKGLAEGVLPDGRLLNDSGGILLISGTIDLTN